MAAAGRVACTVTDHRVIGLSGLIVTDSGYVSISDSNVDKSAIRVWFFDKKCHVTRSISYPTSAFDPEDAAIGRDGTIYVADIGDNDRTRASIAVWRIKPGSSTPHIFRYRYPDHAHDAEAILLAADDTPIVVTKDIGGGEIFVPTGPADPSGKPVLLRRSVSSTRRRPRLRMGWGCSVGLLITGGANSRDRESGGAADVCRRVRLGRVGGDVVKAITTTTPVVVPLPGEPQGESVAFDPSGTHLFTVSDREVSPVRTPILEYSLPSLRRRGGSVGGAVGGSVGGAWGGRYAYAPDRVRCTSVDDRGAGRGRAPDRGRRGLRMAAPGARALAQLETGGDARAKLGVHLRPVAVDGTLLHGPFHTLTQVGDDVADQVVALGG